MTIQFILYNFFITFISSYINIPFLCDSLHVFLIQCCVDNHLFLFIILSSFAFHALFTFFLCVSMCFCNNVSIKKQDSQIWNECDWTKRVYSDESIWILYYLKSCKHVFKICKSYYITFLY